jgi:hypothetical protein
MDWVITSSPTVFMSSSIFSTLTRIEPESPIPDAAVASDFEVVVCSAAVRAFAGSWPAAGGEEASEAAFAGSAPAAGGEEEDASEPPGD